MNQKLIKTLPLKIPESGLEKIRDVKKTLRENFELIITSRND